MTSDLQQLKKDLRKQAFRQRRQIESLPDDIDRIVTNVERHINPAKDQIISGYWPINGELDITPLLSRFTDAGVTCSLPVVRENTLVLNFGVWDENTKFKAGPYGIREPVIEDEKHNVLPDILLLPLLAFDRAGMRLGYGGGYYDKTLVYLKEHKSVLSIGIAYDQQVCLFPLPNEDHDIPLDLVITPSRVYNFKE